MKPEQAHTLSDDYVAALYQLYITSNPDGTKKQFLKRLKKIEELNQDLAEKMKHPSSLIKYLAEKGRIKWGA